MSKPSPYSAPHAPLDDLYLPIDIHKVTHARTCHPISYFVSYDQLSLYFRVFAPSITSESISRLHVEVAQVPTWKASMDLEVEALVSHEI